MATALHSKPRLADFILSEANGQLSRENVLVTQAVDTPVASGTVLKVTAGKYVPYDGTGTAAGILYNHLPAQSVAGDARAVAFVRDCEVKRTALVGLDSAAETALKAIGIVIRNGGTTGISTPAL